MAMYKKGVPISYVRDFLEHTSADATMVYAYADESTIRESLEAVGHEPIAKQKKWKQSERVLFKYCSSTAILPK